MTGTARLSRGAGRYVSGRSFAKRTTSPAFDNLCSTAVASRRLSTTWIRSSLIPASRSPARSASVVLADITMTWSHTAAACEHGFPFAAVLEQNNLLAVQFHPEKSGEAGWRVLRNFLEWAQ